MLLGTMLTWGMQNMEYIQIRYTKVFFVRRPKNISLNVAASKIDKELLHKIMQAIMDRTFDSDESLKLEIYNAINREL